MVEVQLREVVDDDLRIIFDQQRDPVAWEMAAFASRVPHDRGAFHDHWERILHDPDVVVRVIEGTGDLSGTVLGYVSAFPIEGERHVGYWIGRDHWGRGIATAALQALIELLPDQALHAGTVADNSASQRVLQKCGFTRVGERIAYAQARGEQVRELLWRLDRPRSHWNRVYETRAIDTVSWYQPSATTSLRLIRAYADPGATIIDVGAGASFLADELLAEGREVTLLDVSDEALSLVRGRLASHAAGGRLHTITSNIVDFRPERTWQVWHDRAVLHFLIDPQQRQDYARIAADAVAPGGVAIIGGFAPDGPTHCSGLPTWRVSARERAELFASDFALIGEEAEIHRTPSGADQSFSWSILRRSPA